MTTTFDPTSDFEQIADQTETVTLRRRGGSAVETVEGALRRGLARSEVEASDGKYQTADVRWHLPGSELAEPPRLGDRIIDAAGLCWTVLAVAPQTVASRYQVVARDLILAAGLNDRVDIQMARMIKGPAGDEIVEWKKFLPSLRARIQPVAGKVLRDDGRTSWEATHQVFLAEDVAVDHRHRIVADDGRVFRVIGSGKQQRIDALMEIHVVLVGSEAARGAVKR